MHYRPGYIDDFKTSLLISPVYYCAQLKGTKSVHASKVTSDVTLIYH